MTAFAALLLAAGCTTTTQGAPSIDPSSPAPSGGRATWDPCTALTDDQLVAAGLDPADRTPYDGASGGATEAGCNWSAIGTPSAYTVDIGASNRSVDEWLANPTKTSTETTVAGRRAADFMSGPTDPNCSYAIEYSGGTAIIAVVPAGTQFQRDRSCPVAQTMASALVPTLP